MFFFLSDVNQAWSMFPGKKSLQNSCTNVFFLSLFDLWNHLKCMLISSSFLVAVVRLKPNMLFLGSRFIFPRVSLYVQECRHMVHCALIHVVSILTLGGKKKGMHKKAQPSHLAIYLWMHSVSCISCLWHRFHREAHNSAVLLASLQKLVALDTLSPNSRLIVIISLRSKNPSTIFTGSQIHTRRRRAIHLSGSPGNLNENQPPPLLFASPLVPSNWLSRESINRSAMAITKSTKKNQQVNIKTYELGIRKPLLGKVVTTQKIQWQFVRLRQLVMLANYCNATNEANSTILPGLCRHKQWKVFQ